MSEPLLTSVYTYYVVYTFSAEHPTVKSSLSAHMQPVINQLYIVLQDTTAHSALCCGFALSYTIQSHKSCLDFLCLLCTGQLTRCCATFIKDYVRA